jgi:hypothetical protein
MVPGDNGNAQGEVSFILGIIQETPTFVTIYPHVVVYFFLHQHSWYNMLVEETHLQIFNVDCVATTNLNSNIFYHLIIIRAHNFLHLLTLSLFRDVASCLCVLSD